MEIERKWKLKRLPLGFEWGVFIRQGYIWARKSELRLREKDGKFFLTYKSGGTLSRKEIEMKIPGWIFKLTWWLTAGRRISKTRYCEKMSNGLMMEFDNYSGSLNGLVVLEIEFPDEASANAFNLPPNIQGEDVTSDKRYKNKNLALNGLPK